MDRNACSPEIRDVCLHSAPPSLRAPCPCSGNCDCHLCPAVAPHSLAAQGAQGVRTFLVFKGVICVGCAHFNCGYTVKLRGFLCPRGWDLTPANYWIDRGDEWVHLERLYQTPAGNTDSSLALSVCALVLSHFVLQGCEWTGRRTTSRSAS